MKRANQKKKPVPPCEPWQVGAYSRSLEIKIILPYQFLLLSKLWDVKPIDIITGFLDNLAHASWRREGREGSKQKLVEYILLSGYGKDHYSEEQITQMFRELDAMGLLFPWNAGDKLLDSYCAFRESFYKHWFENWYYKARRKQP